MTEAVSHSAVAPEEGSCTLERWHYTYCVTSHLRGESSTQFIRTKEDFLRPPHQQSFNKICFCGRVLLLFNNQPLGLLCSWITARLLGKHRLTLRPPLCAVCPPGRHRGPPASDSHGTLGDNLRLHYFSPHVYALLFRNQFNMARLLQQ